MPNLPLAFGEIGIGGILLAVGLSETHSFRDVLNGKATFGKEPVTAPAATGTTPSGPSVAAGVSGSGNIGATNSAGQPTVKGVGRFDGKPVALWIIPILTYARAHGWKGHVDSGFRSFAEQTAIYNSGVRPAATPGHSNHEGDAFPRGAVDVTEAAQLSQILQASPFRKLLIWAGSQDPPHFSFPHGGGY